MSTLIPLVLLAGSLAGPAAAADFTFEVPVRIQNIPNANVARVTCRVSTIPVEGPNAMAPANIVGSSTKNLVMNGRSDVQGLLEVEVDASGTHPASAARSYNCNMHVNTTIGQIMSGSPDHLVAQAAGGRVVERVFVVKGNLP